MINHYLQKLQESGIKVESIDLTDFIIKNIDFEKSFKTEKKVHIISDVDELQTETVYYYSFNDKYLSLTYAFDYVHYDFDIDKEKTDSNEMKIAEFIRSNWDKINFKMSD